MPRTSYNSDGGFCPLRAKACTDNCELLVKVEQGGGMSTRTCAITDIAVSLDVIMDEVISINAKAGR